MAGLTGLAGWWRLHTVFSDETQASLTLVGPEHSAGNGGAAASPAPG